MPRDLVTVARRALQVFATIVLLADLAARLLLLPMHSDALVFNQAVDEHRVIAVERSEPSPFWNALEPMARQTGFTWIESDGSRRYAASDTFVDGSSSNPRASSRRASTANLPSTDTAGSVGNALDRAAGLVVLALYLAAIFGSQPRRKTRWAWFWTLGLPFYVGPLMMLWRDLPWSPEAAAMPELLPHWKQRSAPGGDPRTTGGPAFGTMLLAGLLASAATLWIESRPPSLRLALLLVPVVTLARVTPRPRQTIMAR